MQKIINTNHLITMKPFRHDQKGPKINSMPKFSFQWGLGVQAQEGQQDQLGLHGPGHLGPSGLQFWS